MTDIPIEFNHLLVAHGSAGTVDHYDENGTFLRYIETVGFSHGDLEVEVFGMDFDPTGNFYCVVPGTDQDPPAGPPQIEKFNNLGVSQGPWSTAPFNWGTSPSYDDQLFATDIKHLPGTDHFAVIAERGSFYTPATREIWLLDVNGDEINHWTVDADPPVHGIPHLSVGADGHTIFYLTSYYNDINKNIFRFDINTGTQLAPLVTLAGPPYFKTGLMCTPDGGVVVGQYAGGGGERKLVRYSSTGSIVWETPDLTPLFPADEYITMGRDRTFWTDENDSAEQWSLDDGSFIQSFVNNPGFAPPEDPGYDGDYVPCLAVRLRPGHPGLALYPAAADAPATWGPEFAL